MSRIERRLNCSYLYHDGTLFQLFEEYRGGVKLGETVDATLGYADVRIYPSYNESRGFSTAASNKGRIVFHRYSENGMLKAIKGSKVEAILPSFEAGSENTRKAGLRIGSLAINNPKLGKFRWDIIENLLDNGLTLQIGEEYVVTPKDGRTWTVGMLWGMDSRINKVTDLRKSKGEN